MSAAQGSAVGTETPRNSSVRDALTAKPRKRPKQHRETPKMAGFVKRALSALGKRVEGGDVEDLVYLLELRDHADQVLRSSVQTLHDSGRYSWAQIGRGAGITRQSAQERWGR